ncbi:MAG TPA: hypothetical protein VMF90_20970 [Rhizobiaceae bacterium]|nr:hypothetical protein [Rhizobiaceae bacterium]
MSKQPFLTLANFVEYATTSSATRRRAIIEQYHNPQVYPFNWHGASDAIFAGRVCADQSVESLIDSEKVRLKSQITGEGEKDKRINHVLELVEFLEVSDVARVAAGATAISEPTLPQDMLIEGLTIRVRANVLLSRQKEGKRFKEFGVAKCHCLSSQKLDEVSAKAYTVALNVFAERVLVNADIQPDLCRVYDLYEDTLHKAPSAQKRLRTLINETAREVCDRWDIVGRRLLERRIDPRKAS